MRGLGSSQWPRFSGSSLPALPPWPASLVGLAILAEGGKGFVCCDPALEFSALAKGSLELETCSAEAHLGHTPLLLSLAGPTGHSVRVDTGLTFPIPGEGRFKEGVFGLESGWGMLGEGVPHEAGWGHRPGDGVRTVWNVLVWGEEVSEGRQERALPRCYWGRRCYREYVQQEASGQRERSWTPSGHSGLSPSQPQLSLPACSPGSSPRESLRCPCPFCTHRLCCDLLLRGRV